MMTRLFAVAAAVALAAAPSAAPAQEKHYTNFKTIGPWTMSISPSNRYCMMLRDIGTDAFGLSWKAATSEYSFLVLDHDLQYSSSTPVTMTVSFGDLDSAQWSSTGLNSIITTNMGSSRTKRVYDALRASLDGDLHFDLNVDGGTDHLMYVPVDNQFLEALEALSACSKLL